MKADILIRFLKVFLRNPVLEKKEVVKGKIRDQMRRGNRECINIPKFDATALYVYDGQSAETQEIMRKQGIAPERALKRPVKRCPDRKEGMLRDYTKPKSTRRGKITPAVKNDVLPTVNAAVIKKCEKANVPLHMNLPIRSRDAEATAPGAFPLPAGCAANISRKISRWVDKDNFRIYRQRERSRSPNAKDETEMDQRERERPKGRIMRMHTRAIDELAEHLADTHVEFAGEEKNDLEIRENLDPFGLN
ncbi:hypothetical protein GQ43DRAFT_476221 [Delitschia confertaspora ATCC 74209]|uniref:Uncharacterized protein n=1 Tax=Delitschia confertaspora ATCC 74209 TaxID=1513339 RepID=A0A9P4JEU9_9PLEO|nr:hypothetical protein GQ43DRAFT_476221 [Delitschia confertaspora ATCC 74209]